MIDILTNENTRSSIIDKSNPSLFEDINLDLYLSNMEIISYSNFLEDIKIVFRYIMNTVYSSSPRKQNLVIKNDNQLNDQEIWSEILEDEDDCELLKLRTKR